MVEERRTPSRYPMRIPLRFRLAEDSNSGKEISSETLNISSQGFCMQLKQRIKVGSLLALNLRVPTEVSGSPFVELCCTGRIAWEGPRPEGMYGYGVAIERVSPGEATSFVRGTGSPPDKLRTRTL
jgi:PilZ domain